ncbi:GerMN domain-containing protein [Fusibacter tunisiensis]|jgi:hypothetical protein|uniref:GerMN domain-containing protein n=1 Tax=Fusibacter tunisiensis TaxID=1008308 RepID=A0ABS2MRE8_9FIRM|nr:GerMN domain-containing protein [Fusibacter tunisiensis]MBM7561981.1 hypothetical protein [Fusibacter tunisiensis]
MIKFFTNIIFILILLFLATALPLSTDILSLNLTQPIVDPTETTTAEPTPPHLSWTDRHISENQSWDLVLSSSNGNFPDDWASFFTVEYKGQKSSIENIPLLNALSNSSIANDGLHVTLPLNELLPLDIEDYYTVRIESQNELYPVDPITLQLSTYKEKGTYPGATNTDGSYMTLYVPNESYSRVVPISLSFDPGDNRWRSLYNALHAFDSVSYGLNSELPIVPYAPKMRIRDRIASVYIFDDELQGFDGKFPLITESVSKSLLSLGYIEGVKFVINDKTTGRYEDVNLETVYSYENELSVFVGTRSNFEAVYLMPIPLNQTQDAPFEDRLNALVDGLSFTALPVTLEKSWIQMLPSNTSLMAYTLENETLILDFNIELSDVYLKFQDLLTDSLIQTFTSLKEVTKVIIKIDGTEISSGTAYKYLNAY